MIKISISNTSNNILPSSSSSLVTSRLMTRNFGSPEDYIELYVTDPAGKVIASSIPCLDFTIPDNIPNSTTIQNLNLNVEDSLTNLGINYGDYKLVYNILRPAIIKSFNRNFFIKEISGDRTEIRLSSNIVPISSLTNEIISFINNYQSASYFKEFYLNFGDNQLIPAINIALDTTGNNPTILIKLINPLPGKFLVNSLLNIVDALSDPITFNVSVDPPPVIVTYPTLRGPNFDLDLDNLRVGPTPYYNFNQITSFQGNFAPQLQQLLGQLSASNFAINVDYTDYKDFIHFSSAARRLEGFQYKLQNIELYTSQSSSAILSPSPISQLDAVKAQNNINKTIQSFDGWEQYLYYESGAYSWPKQNSTKPYINYSVTASQAVNWYNGNYDSASLYDDNNQNYLLYTLPGFLTENNDNELAFKFVASLGQMFDDIWIHIKAITELYQAKNALSEGISKDLVYFALQSMGVDVYTDQDGTDVFRYLYGINPDGSYKPITGSYDTLVSASNYQLPGQDIQKGIYKRMYHNLPLLLKSKGTNRFIQYLNTIFGVPSTIMSYIEYGGVDKVTSSFEYEYDRFTYGLELSGSNTVNIPWVYTSQSLNRTGFNDIAPNGIEFRFKAFTTSSDALKTNYVTQSLFYNSTNYNLYLLYTDTGSNNSIYSNTIGKFGYLQFKLGSTSVTSSTVPIFETGSDGETSWYTVLVQRRIPDRRIGDVGLSQTYDIYIKNNIWGETGHIASASLTTSTQNASWYTNGTTLTFGGGIYPFSGSIQEARLWSYYVPEFTFDSHVLNPESIEGNYTTSSFNDLAARFTLGNNLYTYNHNITTEVYSTHPDQDTQILAASFTNFPNRNNYSNFVETYYADVANSGYANPVVDKIRIYSGSEYGTQLMVNRSIEIPPVILPTKDIHLLDASLSPMDEIDRAIIAQFGSTYDLDDIIGDPNGGLYNNFYTLQYEFFKKFNNKYNYKDYIRLIEFFHNSLFRTLKDFTPARTNLATGIVYKPHLLERSVVLKPEPNVIPIGLLSTIDTAFISASNGGDYSQSIYNYTVNSNLGDLTLTSDGRDFYVGEFPSASVSFEDVVYQYNPFTIYNSAYITSSIHSPLNYSESIWYYGYYPLLNNVPRSVLSKIRKKLTYITDQNKLTQILEPVELQDFTYNYVRHARPRYNGVKTTSQKYNFYTTGDGDVYGKNAAIDKNTLKFAFFISAFATGSDLLAMPERTNLNIKYLIDEESNLDELTRRDYDIINEQQKFNLYQVQNTFKSGERLNINLFDSENPSNQSNLNGNKQIFAGGFRFHPVLWRTGSYNLFYAADPNTFPQGIGNYLINNFGVQIIPNAPAPDYFKSRIAYIGPTLTQTVNITYEIVYLVEGAGGPADPPDQASVTLTATILPGNTLSPITPNSINYISIISTRVINVVAQVINTPYGQVLEDTNPELTFAGNGLWITCSQAQSSYYGGFYMSSSFGFSEYPFSLSPGDLIRFMSYDRTIFEEFYEYEILEVSSSAASVTFRVNNRIQNVLTSSYDNGTGISSIDRYIISRKIPDETNIVIKHRKRDGITSPGITKNINLLQKVDDKLANIVSELKSKIFSTLLTS